MSAGNFDKTIKGLSSQTLVTIVLGILEIVSFSIMSRLLTKTEFGYYAAIMSVIMIFRSLAEAGIGASVIQRKNADSSYINTAYSLALVVGIIATIIVVLLSNIFSRLIADDTICIPLMLISVTLIPYSLNSVYKAFLLKHLHFLRLGIFQIAAFVVSNTIAVIMAVYNCGLYSIVTGNILNILLQNVILRYFSQTKFNFSIDRNKISDILSFGGWLTLSRLTGSIYNQLDKILMAKLLSVYELGNFYRTRGLIESINSQIGGVFDVTLFPILSGIQDEREAIQNAYKKSLNLGCIFFSLLFLYFFFNAKLIIYSFLGEKWLDQILLFRVLSFSMVIYFFTRLADCFIRSLALVKFGFAVKLLSCCLLIVGILFFYIYGSIGIAVVILVTNIISATVKTWYICHRTGVSMGSLFQSTIRGLLYSIPLVVLGIAYLLLYDSTFINSVMFFLLFTIAVQIILLRFPKVVGGVYYKQIYPVLCNKIRVLYHKLK